MAEAAMNMPKMDMPDMPKIDMPDMPKMSIPGCPSKQDIADAKKELTEIQSDLNAKLTMELPKVNIKIPRLEALPGEVSAPEASLAASEAVPLVDSVELLAPDIPPIPQVPTGQALLDSALPYVSAAIGVAIGTASAVVSKGNPSYVQLMGTALASTVVVTLGSAKSWDGKAMQVQTAAMVVVGNAKKKIGTVLDQVDDILCKPISGIEKQIDSIGKEDPLKKVLTAGKTFEKTTGKNVPDPQDFKKPLDGIPQTLEKKVGEVKRMINEKIDDYVPDVVEKPSLFRMLVVVLPMIVLLLLNTAAAFATMPTPAAPAPANNNAARRLFLDVRPIMFEEEVQHVHAVSQYDTLTKDTVQRRLGDKDESKGAREEKKEEKGENAGDEKGENADDGKVRKEEKGENADDGDARKSAPDHRPEEAEFRVEELSMRAADDDMLAKVMPLIRPQLTQAVITIVAAILGMILTAKPFLLKQLNGAIALLEGKVNKKIEEEMKEMVDRVFGATFKELQDKSAEFFPKMIDLLESLEKVPGVA